jgi:hypothetical protein
MTTRSLTGLVILVILVLSGVPSSVLMPNSDLVRAAPACETGLHLRTPNQVLADFRAALAAGDWAAVRCCCSILSALAPGPLEMFSNQNEYATAQLK